MRMMFRRERLQIHYQALDLDTIIAFMDIIHHPVFYLKQHFGDWFMSLSSGKNILNWAHLIVVVHISGPEDRDRIQSPNRFK
jgi:hypothetical protein